jgi:hypothetical protein
LVIFHQDGSLSCAEGTMFGGYVGATEVYSPGHGTWIKTGAGTFRGTRLGLIFDKTSGVLIGIGRSRFSFHFVDGKFDRIEGRLFLESLSCPDGPFACPDPLDPAAVWTPLTPPDGWPASAKRIRAVRVGPLP